MKVIFEMKKLTAFIGALLSLIPLGQPLIIKTGVVLSTTGLILAVSENVHAEDASFYANRGQQRYAKRDYYGCISDFSKVIELQSKYLPYSYRRRGHCKYFLKDYSGALIDFNKSMKLNPNNNFTYEFRADTKQKMGDQYGAISDYSEAIKLKPNDSYAYYFRGISKFKLGDKTGACIDMRKASSLGDQLAFRMIKDKC